MKKLGNRGGFTLMEVLVSMLILTFLVVGMGPGMKTALSVYQESTFQSSSTALTGTLNATLEDLLRYGEDIEVAADGTVTFTNLDYGLQGAQFLCWKKNDSNAPTVVTVKDSRGAKALLPEGSYPNMEITAFEIQYKNENGVFTVEYTIASTVVSDSRDVTLTVAALNLPEGAGT